MPTVFRERGYRFFFYSNEHLPIHVHVEKGNATAKFAVSPVLLMKAAGFNTSSLAEIRNLVVINKELIINSWHEHFRNQ